MGVYRITLAQKNHNPKPGRPARKKIFGFKDLALLREIKRKAFKNQVRRQVLDLLPPAPYKIGIDKDMFELLKSGYEGRYTKLRREIGGILHRLTESYLYLHAMAGANHRNGINGERFPLDEGAKEYSRRKMAEICEQRKRLTRKCKRK